MSLSRLRVWSWQSESAEGLESATESEEGRLRERICSWRCFYLAISSWRRFYLAISSQRRWSANCSRWVWKTGLDGAAELVATAGGKAHQEIVKKLVSLIENYICHGGFIFISTSEEIAQVGTISANGEREIGELIAKAMKKVDKRVCNHNFNFILYFIIEERKPMIFKSIIVFSSPLNAILLRNLVWATSKHDVYLISNYLVMHWSSLSGNLSEIINFAGHVAPSKQLSQFFYVNTGFWRGKGSSFRTPYIAIIDALPKCGSVKGDNCSGSIC
ncbi:hypothetical protein Ahy_A06g030164 isoform A [Arachis hypogaea]|uniref:Uncharacterized protein n=1 Tax=Arachis hypogaea TaxID=3818 RepID=A0A445CVI4_ARAHY|nr:hypothetical protein Ahy_A06g030164 isoform A [Arachis hypogaea]